MQRAECLDIVGKSVIRDYLIERRGGVKLAATRIYTLHHRHITVGEALYLALPLIFKRCRAHYQGRRHHAPRLQQLGCADGLHGLAKPHLICDKRTPGAESKPNSLYLIGIELRLEHGADFLVGHIGHKPTAAVALVEYEVEGVAADIKPWVEALYLLYESRQLGYHAGHGKVIIIEIAHCRHKYIALIGRAGAKTQTALPHIAYVDSSVSRQTRVGLAIFAFKP